MVSKALKYTFIGLTLGAILVTLWGGLITFEQAPPYPGRVVGPDGGLLADRESVLRGQGVFQKYGLMDVGSVWGHGTYRGTEFTADCLHRMGQEVRQSLALARFGKPFAELTAEEQGTLDTAAAAEIKRNTYDAGTDTLTLSPAMAAAFVSVQSYYEKVFSEGKRDSAILPNAIADAGERRDLSHFFFWTAWAAGTLRPGKDMTYTNNWPPDVSVGNTLSSEAMQWTVVSIIAFLAFLGVMTFVFHWFKFFSRDPEEYHLARAMAVSPISASQRKTAKYFLVVTVLFLLQTTMGGLIAHYTVHPASFYGMDAVAQLVPYQWAKSWHLQLAVFWIAVSWIGMTLYAAPLIGGREPKKQGLLVDILFAAVVVVAGGALSGIALGVHNKIGANWFWFGHQGWEYLELGRLWQLLLFAGLLIWLGIVVRALKDHFRKGTDKWDVPHFVAYAGVAIAAFFAFGLFYNPRTHLTVADFWRWWVVHTWVEGMFEFFAAAAIAFVTVNLGLARRKDALRVAYMTAMLALSTGIIGVGHHYYWFGDPSLWFALGGVISALEPVPVLLLMAKVWQEMRALKNAGQEFPYKWPMFFLMASSAWAFIGAGVFGFTITTPVVNYYEHSTYLTVNHGHTALLGTYGFLAIGLLLFSLRGLVKPEAWKDKWLKVSFFGINVGLFLMFAGTLLPVGILQLVDSFRYGLWHARSPEFYNQPFVHWIGQVRMLPDTIIIVCGVVPLVLFAAKAFLNLKPVQVADGAAWPEPPAKSE